MKEVNAVWALKKVSIQPKPKTGLEEVSDLDVSSDSVVSIQPKPKTGLEDGILNLNSLKYHVSIQPKPKTGLEERIGIRKV